MSTLDAIRSYNDRHAAGTGAHVREVASDMGAMLRVAMTDNRTPTAAGAPARETVTRTTRRPVQPTECPAGKMLIPDTLSYATVDALLAQLAPCKYALRKADGVISFFEVREYKGKNRIRLLSGAPGQYQRHTMGLPMQYMAVRHLLDDPAAAIKLFADKAGHCARCHSPLTDATSLAVGLGPDCRKKL